MTGYVAPARYPLTVLHLEDPDGHTLTDLFRPEGRIDGWTRCGRPFLEGELWRRLERRESDRVCAACAGTAEDVQEALL